MFEKLKSMFNKKQLSEVEKIDQKLELILHMPVTVLLENREKLIDCINRMKTELTRVNSLVNDCPDGEEIPAAVWFDGAALGNMAEDLAHYLADKNWHEEQSEATDIWVGAILSVCSNYHHLVGPAMIANASIKEKLGNLEYAKKAYSAVVKDFEYILECIEEESFRPQEESLIAIQSLQTACKKLIKINKLSGDDFKVFEILNRIKELLIKPEKLNND